MAYADPERERLYRCKMAANQRARDPEKARNYVRAWREKNRDADRAAARRWARENPERAETTMRRNRYLKYGIPIEIFEAMVAEQDGRCAICNALPKEGRRLSVDHDHGTGKVRALLCISCNTGVGYFERPIGVAIIDYLEKHRGI